MTDPWPSSLSVFASGTSEFAVARIIDLASESHIPYTKRTKECFASTFKDLTSMVAAASMATAGWAVANA